MTKPPAKKPTSPKAEATPEPYSAKIAKLMAALLSKSRATELVPLGTGKLLCELREQAEKEGVNFKGLLRQAQWEPMKARSLIGLYRSHREGTLTDALIEEIGWTRLKIVGSKLDEDPKSKAWVTKAKSTSPWRKLAALVRGDDEFSEVSTEFHQTPERRDRMNVALCRFGAVLHPRTGGRTDLVYGRDAAMDAMVDFVLDDPKPTGTVKALMAKLAKVPA